MRRRARAVRTDFRYPVAVSVLLVVVALFIAIITMSYTIAQANNRVRRAEAKLDTFTQEQACRAIKAAESDVASAVAVGRIAENQAAVGANQGAFGQFVVALVHSDRPKLDSLVPVIEETAKVANETAIAARVAGAEAVAKAQDRLNTVTTCQ